MMSLRFPTLAMIATLAALPAPMGAMAASEEVNDPSSVEDVILQDRMASPQVDIDAAEIGDAAPLEKGARPEAPGMGAGGTEPPAGGSLQGNVGVGTRGITLFERMGAPLPDLPQEPEYKGPLDEAYGAFQRGQYITAIDKALPRAQLGDPAAQTLLAELMTLGLGVKKDTKGAAFWYGQAAQGGDPAGMFKYALLLMEGRDVERDKAKADEFMKKAADAGNPSAQFNWGQTLVAENPGTKGLDLAMPYYEKSAENGIADAQYALSQIYRALPTLPEEKRNQARDYLLRAAKSGFDTAQLDMGIWFVNGIGGERDYEQGFHWLTIAANRGNVVAQNRLAHLYINALGTRPNPVEAAKWYVLSRRAGLKDAALEDFYLGIDDEQQKKGIEAANRFRVSKRTASPIEAALRPLPSDTP